jgi:hypothetical protein
MNNEAPQERTLSQSELSKMLLFIETLVQIDRRLRAKDKSKKCENTIVTDVH